MKRTALKRRSGGISRSRMAPGRKRMKSKPLTDSQKADIKFSLMIRERDKWTCRRCGKDHSENHAGLDCSHFFGRDHYAVRYDPENAIALCHTPCHVQDGVGWEYQKREGMEYLIFMEDWLGPRNFVALGIRAMTRCKLRDAVEAFMVSVRGSSMGDEMDDIHDTDSGSLNEKGRWWGPEFCQIPADQQPIMDGCYFCGRPVHGLNGEHDHTMSEKEGFQGAARTRYSCVCESC